MVVFCITGANRGLGLEFVRQLSSRPDTTIIATTRSMSSDLDELKSFSSSSAKLHVLECDTSSPGSIESFASSVASLLQADSLKITHLLNNAATNSVPEQSSLTMKSEDLHRELDINILGPALVVQSLVSQSLLGNDVRVMNITSGLGSKTKSLTMEPRKCATYSITKAGLNMLTVHQSGDLREKAGLDGAVVVCIDPGWVKTRMGGEGAILEPEESISGMLKVLDHLEYADTGKCYEYTGDQLPW